MGPVLESWRRRSEAREACQLLHPARARATRWERKTCDESPDRAGPSVSRGPDSGYATTLDGSAASTLVVTCRMSEIRDSGHGDRRLPQPHCGAVKGRRQRAIQGHLTHPQYVLGWSFLEGLDVAAVASRFLPQRQDDLACRTGCPAAVEGERDRNPAWILSREGRGQTEQRRKAKEAAAAKARCRAAVAHAPCRSNHRLMLAAGLAGQ